jgi:single-stranded-DNA-specific exonuclease
MPKWTLAIPKREGSVLEDLRRTRGLGDPTQERWHDSFLMQDMQLAVDRIRLAIRSKQRIHIVGDYDADGVTSVAVLLRGLRSLGADPTWFLPDRTRDGYGLRTHQVEDAKQKGATLLITADNGTSAYGALERAKELGLDVIVVDHHMQTGARPPVLALLNPKVPLSDYPFDGLAAVGVAIKLLHALGCKIVGDLLDLAALGTVSDMAPLRGENRALVSKGLKQLPQTKWPGLRALLEQCSQRGAPINTRTLSWRIGPRINAAGRLEHPKLALQLLLSDNRQEAKRLGLGLEAINQRRRDLQQGAVDAVLEELEKAENLPALVVVIGEWHLGILGLIAGRLAQDLGKPCVVLSRILGDGVLKGSARSVPGFDITAALARQRTLLVEFGGHKEAAGLTMSEMQLEKFKSAISEDALDYLSESAVPAFRVDLCLGLHEAKLDLVRELRELEPFGVGNPEPVFLLESMRVERIFALSQGKHHRLTLAKGSKSIECIFWNSKKQLAGLHYGDCVDVAGSLESNSWNQKVTLQFNILEIWRTSPGTMSDGSITVDPLHEGLQ